MTRTFAVTAVGRDRPGIVAAVTEALFEAGCNLSDVSSTILQGHFAMTMVVEAPEGTDPQRLQRDLGALEDRIGTVVHVWSVDATHSRTTPSTHVVSVYGADRPGIVYRASSALAANGVNVTALTSRTLEGDEPVYTLLLEVAGGDLDKAHEDLRRLSEELSVDVTVHPIEPDLL